MLFETNTLSRLFFLSEIYMCILLFDALSSVIEINKLTSKGMLNIYYWEKLTSQNFDFLGGKIWRNALVLKVQKATRYFPRNVYFGIIVFSCLSSPKLCPRFLLTCFAREIKGFIKVPEEMRMISRT